MMSLRWLAVPLMAAWVMAAGAWGATLPSPALLVLNKEDATLMVIDPGTGKVAWQAPTGESPHEIVVSSDGKLAFVTNYGSKTPGMTLSVFDLEKQQARPKVDLSPLTKPHGIAWGEGKVWFTAEASKVIGRYDPATNKVDLILGTGQNGTHMVEMSGDGQRLYTANIAGDSISIFGRTPDGAGWNQTVVPVGKGPEGFDLSRDGRELWAAHSRDGGISILDIGAKSVTGSFSIGTKRSNRLKFTLDGKHVLVSDLSGNELVIVDPAKRAVVKKMALGKMPEGILMDPNGKVAYIALAGDDEIAVLDLGTLEVMRRLKTGKGPDGMAWLPARGR